MHVLTHAVVGVIDLPDDTSWSPDSLVQSWLDLGQRGGVSPAVSRRLTDFAIPSQVSTDLGQLRRELSMLLDRFRTGA